MEKELSLKILLPSGMFVDAHEVQRLVVKSSAGLFGILPRRLDCVMILPPGILTYTTSNNTNVSVAIDKGTLTKIKSEIVVSVRNAIGERPLAELRHLVTHEFAADQKRKSKENLEIGQLETRFFRNISEMCHATR